MTTIRLRAGQRTIIKLKQVGLRGLQGEQGIQGVAGIDGVDGAVSSVNTQIGDVVLDQDDVLDGVTNKQYSATEKTKLAGIEANADVTDATNVAAAGAYMKLTDSAADVAYDDTVGTLYGVTGDDTQEYTDNLTVAMGTLFGQIIGADLPAKISYTETSTASMDFVIDEDNMASNSATKVPTQQSTKAYVDTQVGAIPELTEGNGITLTDLGGGVTEISVDGASVDHGSLAGLSDDDHTQYALLAGRSGGQTLRGGTSKTNNLVLSANSQAYDNKSYGYIETTHPIVWDDNINIGATFTGFFSEGYHRFISQTGTFTLDPTMNAGEVVALKSAATIKYSSSQIITASPTFLSQNTIQPTAAVNDNALASWSSYIANDKFMPLLTTAITATTANFAGLQTAPTVGITAGSHASAKGVVTNLTAVEAASKVTSQGTATNARGVLVHSSVKEGSGIVTNNIGVDIESMTSGSTLNVGLRIAPSTSTGAQAIQITGTPTTAAGGITFGSDVNLYRSAANTLKTDDNFTIGAYTLPNTDGTSGQVLQTNGSGTVAWGTPSGGSGGGMTVPLPSAFHWGTRITSNVNIPRDQTHWIPLPVMAHDVKITDIWLDITGAIASCTATAAIVTNDTGTNYPTTKIASTSVGAIDLSGTGIKGASLTSPVTVSAGTRVWVAFLPLGGSSDPACRAVDTYHGSIGNHAIGTAPVTPSSTTALSGGAFRKSSQTSIVDSPTGLSTDNVCPLVYVSVEEP